MTCGIYEIVNRVNGKRYVGQSLNIEKRWSYHRQDLTRGNHHSAYLQRSWDKYGEASFLFIIINECEPEEMNDLEQHEINKKSEYNNSKTAGSPRGVKHTKETRENSSVRMKDEWRTNPVYLSLREPDRLKARGKAISKAKLAVKNYNEDDSIYEFYHEDHGTIRTTQKSLWKTYGLNRGSVNNLIHGRKRTVHGWTIKKPPIKGA